MANFFSSPHDLLHWVREENSSPEEAITKIASLIGPRTHEQDVAESVRRIFARSDANAAEILFGILSAREIAEPELKTATETVGKLLAAQALHDNKKISDQQFGSLVNAAGGPDLLAKMGKQEGGALAKQAQIMRQPGQYPMRLRVCPKLPKSVGNRLISTYNCRHYCLDGLVLDEDDPDGVYCAETLWRRHVMDKFSREWKDAKTGEWVGGYIHNRFYTFPDAGTPANPRVSRDHGNRMALSPWERTRSVRPHEYSTERRLEEQRNPGSTRGIVMNAAADVPLQRQAQSPVCECADGNCPACHGRCAQTGSMILYRVDMEDRTGTLFCEDCVDDAMESGLFTDRLHNEEHQAGAKSSLAKTAAKFLGRTKQETAHGNPGERRVLPANLLVELTPATNLPDDSAIKYWADPVPGGVGWPEETRRWAEDVGVGLHEDDVTILNEIEEAASSDQTRTAGAGGFTKTAALEILQIQASQAGFVRLASEDFSNRHPEHIYRLFATAIDLRNQGWKDDEAAVRMAGESGLPIERVVSIQQVALRKLSTHASDVYAMAKTAAGPEYYSVQQTATALNGQVVEPGTVLKETAQNIFAIVDRMGNLAAPLQFAPGELLGKVEPAGDATVGVELDGPELQEAALETGLTEEPMLEAGRRVEISPRTVTGARTKAEHVYYRNPDGTWEEDPSSFKNREQALEYVKSNPELRRERRFFIGTSDPSLPSVEEPEEVGNKTKVNWQRLVEPVGRSGNSACASHLLGRLRDLSDPDLGFLQAYLKRTGQETEDEDERSFALRRFLGHVIHQEMLASAFADSTPWRVRVFLQKLANHLSELADPDLYPASDILSGYAEPSMLQTTKELCQKATVAIQDCLQEKKTAAPVQAHAALATDRRRLAAVPGAKPDIGTFAQFLRDGIANLRGAHTEMQLPQIDGWETTSEESWQAASKYWNEQNIDFEVVAEHFMSKMKAAEAMDIRGPDFRFLVAFIRACLYAQRAWNASYGTPEKDGQFRLYQKTLFQGVMPAQDVDERMKAASAREWARVQQATQAYQRRYPFDVQKMASGDLVIPHAPRLFGFPLNTQTVSRAVDLSVFRKDKWGVQIVEIGTESLKQTYWLTHKEGAQSIRQEELSLWEPGQKAPPKGAPSSGQSAPEDAESLFEEPSGPPKAKQTEKESSTDYFFNALLRHGAVQFLTGKDYPQLCPSCRTAVDQCMETVQEGPDTDDPEAPLMFAGDNRLLCGGSHCAERERRQSQSP